MRSRKTIQLSKGLSWDLTPALADSVRPAVPGMSIGVCSVREHFFFPQFHPGIGSQSLKNRAVA